MLGYVDKCIVPFRCIDVICSNFDLNLLKAISDLLLVISASFPVVHGFVSIAVEKLVDELTH